MSEAVPDQVLHYKPAGPVLKAFHESQAFVRLIKGPIGSGKSTACVIELLRIARMQQRGPDGKRHSRFAIIRNSYPELRTTTIKTFHDWCPPQYAKYTETPPITHRLVTDELDVEFIFLALDRPEDVKKLLSLELTAAWINEAREVPKAVLDTLTGRVGRYPAKRDGGCTRSCILCDTNPPNDRHWWCRMATGGEGFEDGVPEGWEFFDQPSGLSPEAENLENLPDGYYQRIMAGKEEDWIKVYVHGEYGYLVEGKPVFASFRDGVHVSAEVLEPIGDLPLSIGADFGLTPAAVIGQRQVDGQWRILAELCMEDAGVVRFAETLAGFMAQHFGGAPLGTCWGDPAGAYRDQQERTALELMTTHTGWKWRPAPCGNNDLTIRLEVVKGALGRLIDGKPGIVFSPKCPTLREAMNGRYHYRPIRSAGSDLGHQEFREEPHKNSYSHVADALQYLLLGGGEAQVVRVIGGRRGEQGDRQRFAESDWNELDGPPGAVLPQPTPGPRSRARREPQRFALS